MFAQVADKMLFDQARSYAYAYMDKVNHRSVFPDKEAVDKLAIFEEPLPGHSQSATEILKQLDAYGSPATVAQTGGTSWQDKPAIRISVCSWTTTSDDADRSVQAFIKDRSNFKTSQGG